MSLLNKTTILEIINFSYDLNHDSLLEILKTLNLNEPLSILTNYYSRKQKIVDSESFLMDNKIIFLVQIMFQNENSFYEGDKDIFLMIQDKFLKLEIDAKKKGDFEIYKKICGIYEILIHHKIIPEKTTIKTLVNYSFSLGVTDFLELFIKYNLIDKDYIFSYLENIINEYQILDIINKDYFLYLINDNLDEFLKLVYRKNYKRILKILIEKGCYLNIIDEKYIFSYFESIGNENHFFDLINNNNNLDLLNVKFNELLILACVKGYMKVVKLFIDKGCNINYMNSQKETPLKIASMYKHSDLVELLLANHATYKHSICINKHCKRTIYNNCYKLIDDDDCKFTKPLCAECYDLVYGYRENDEYNTPEHLYYVCNFCYKEAKFISNDLNKEYYCSRDCQKNDWTIQKNLIPELI